VWNLGKKMGMSFSRQKEVMEQKIVVLEDKNEEE